MSDKIIEGYSGRAAMRFNANFAKNPPPEVIAAIISGGDVALAGFAAPPSSVEFAIAVYAFQRRVFGVEADVDGKFGPKTARALAKLANPIADNDPHYTHNGARVRLPRLRSLGAEVVGLEGRFDITRSGAFYTRGPRRVVRRIVIHWGGKNLPHLAGFYLAEPTRSAHFGVDAEGEKGRVAQLLDTGVDAWHSGRAGNYDTIGIDLCQWPDPARARKAYPGLKAGRNVEAAQAGRGFNEIMELDGRIASAARALVFDLLDTFGLEAIPPRDAAGRLTHKWGDAVNVADASRGALATVVAHHHLARQKPDVIGWWGSLFDGTALAP